MAIEIRSAEFDKSFCRRERDNVYDDWRKAFPRELIQNSNDAGASRINIVLSIEDARGSLFQPYDVPSKVLRVVFEDDGCGMDADVIENVFFKPGKSTKSFAGSTVGGFGRARLATHFSAVRHATFTRDRVVEGDGVHYSHLSLSEMRGELIDLVDRPLPGSPGDDDYEAGLACRNGIRSDLVRIEEALVTGGVSGCRMEIDLDPDDGLGGEENAVERLTKRFTEYLSRSAIKPKVTINGVAFDNPLSFRRATRVLRAPFDGEEKDFAKVYFREGADVRHPNKLIVRVGGAAMYESYVEHGVQIVVEVEPRVSREVLTASRDGFKDPYKDILESFKQEMLLDRKSALKSNESVRTIVPGELGVRRIEPVRIDYANVDFTNLEIDPALSRGKKSAAPALSDIELRGHAGLSYYDLHNFFESVRTEWFDLPVPDYREIRSRMKEVLGWRTVTPDVVVEVIDKLGSDADAVLAVVKAARDEERRKAFEEEQLLAAMRIKDHYDVVINVMGNVGGKLADAMRRNDPRKWSAETGSGYKVKATVAVWSAYVDQAFETLQRIFPDTARVGWSPGILYAGTAMENYGYGLKANTPLATYLKPEAEGDPAIVSLNMVDSNGKLRYSPFDANDRRRLQALAIHEVSHHRISWHDENFATVMTAVMGEFDEKKAEMEVDRALTKIREEYYGDNRRSKARIVPLDGGDGVRPAQRLLMAAAPNLTSVLSTEHDDLDHSGIASEFLGAHDMDEGIVDLRRVGALDEEIETAVAHAREHAAVQIPEPVTPAYRP